MPVDINPPVELNTALIASVDFSHTATLFAHAPEPAFYLDSGAMTHISCIQHDFTSLHTIAPHKISGVGNSMVFAIGIGTMALTILANKKCLVLKNVLFALTAGMHLVSIGQLDIRGFSSIFADHGCRITDRTRKLVADRVLMQSMLYTLSSPSSCVSNNAATNNVTLPMLSSSPPDLKTWHHHLGHTNYCTVLDMARGDAVTGMKTNFSPMPSTCDACIRGKQTCNPLPNLHEGPRLSQRLEQMHINLSGPHSVVSRSSFSYIMNIIDNFSSYHWT